MALKFLPLSLRFDFRGFPGSGGTSVLRLYATADGTKVIDGVPDEGLLSEGLVSAVQSWRGVVGFLAEQEACAFFTDGNIEGEYPWPDLMAVKGKENAAADLVAIAWAGEPLVEIAVALSKHSDEVLTALRERHGSLRRQDFLEEMLRIKRWADELSVDFTDIIDRGSRFDFDFRAMRRDVVALARVVRAEEKAGEFRRNWGLFPYQPKIERLIAAWRAANPATSTNTQMGKGMQAGALKAFIEAHVLEKGCLPEGRQTVPATLQLSAFEVDLDGQIAVAAGRRNVADLLVR